MAGQLGQVSQESTAKTGQIRQNGPRKLNQGVYWDRTAGPGQLGQDKWDRTTGQDGQNISAITVTNENKTTVAGQPG